VVELTLIAEEVANLRSWVAEARRDADEAEKAFKAPSARSRKDDEEAARVRKEWDELLQKDTKTRQWILGLLGEVEIKRDLRLGAEEKLTTLKKRASLDATAVTRLRKERDELIQITERLRSKHGVAHGEREQAKLKRETTRKLEAKSVSVGLALDFAEERRNF